MPEQLSMADGNDQDEQERHIQDLRFVGARCDYLIFKHRYGFFYHM